MQQTVPYFPNNHNVDTTANITEIMA